MDILPSAIASFNNAALLPPAFAWLAVMMIPVYFAAWKLAPEILAAFFSAKKARDRDFAFWVEILMIGWLVLGHGNWNVVRDGSTALPYLISACLFLLCRDATARLREMNPKTPPIWAMIKRSRRKWAKLGIFAAVIGAAALSSAREWNLAALQSAAVMFGFSAGYFGARPNPAAGFTTVMMMAMTIGIAMQPEYFRFAQLGRLTLAHMGVLAAAGAAGALTLACRNFAPSGLMRDSHYEYMKWFLRLCCLFALILFAMTESMPVLGGFFALAIILGWLAVKHAPRGTKTADLSGNLWAITIFAFGAAAGLHAAAIIGILAWRNNSQQGFWKNLRSLLK